MTKKTEETQAEPRVYDFNALILDMHNEKIPIPSPPADPGTAVEDAPPAYLKLGQVVIAGLNGTGKIDPQTGRAVTPIDAETRTRRIDLAMRIIDGNARGHYSAAVELTPDEIVDIKKAVEDENDSPLIYWRLGKILV